MDGNMQEQYKMMCTKSKKIAAVSPQCQFHPADINTGYHQVYLPTMKYPLTATTLTKDQCEQIQTPVKEVVLAKLGYN